MKLSVPLNHELCYSLRTRQHIRQILSRKVKILLHTPSISLWLDYSCNEKQIKSCSFEKNPKISQNVTIYSLFEKKPPKVSQTVTIYFLYICSRVSLPGDIQMVSGCGSGQLFWVVLLEQEGWIRQRAEVPSNHSLIL